jgi:hypothetical protein
VRAALREDRRLLIGSAAFAVAAFILYGFVVILGVAR